MFCFGVSVVSLVSLLSFRCFGGFVPVFRRFRWFRFGVSGFSTCPFFHVKWLTYLIKLKYRFSRSEFSRSEVSGHDVF